MKDIERNQSYPNQHAQDVSSFLNELLLIMLMIATPISIGVCFLMDISFWHFYYSTDRYLCFLFGIIRIVENILQKI